MLEPNALPRVSDEAPMQPSDMFALQRASRWSAITPFLSAHSPHERSEPIPTAPVYGAVSADDFQLVPLAGPCVCACIPTLADDVGPGYNDRGRLILAELIRKRRIRRV